MCCAMLFNWLQGVEEEGVRSLPLVQPQFEHPEPAGPPPPQLDYAAGQQRRDALRDTVEAVFQARGGN